jgi:hypothetical protein
MADFVDQSPLDGLQKHIIEQLALGMSPETLPPPYGRYCSIIQSSGMGKSRLLDEFSKSYFLIPINLRSESGGSSYHFYLHGLANLSYRLSSR